MVLRWMDRKRHEAIMQISLEQIFNFYLFTVVSSNLLPYREKSLYLETFRYATRGRDQHFSKQFSMEGGRDNLLVAKFQKIKLRSVHHVEKFSFSMRRLSQWIVVHDEKKKKISFRHLAKRVFGPILSSTNLV